ncbi:FRG domain-containing protein [Anaerolentibacter hominis]|uniref:FRG domain-containing protein n=1 Tax=Anaerolentibacter hominis TaxID=3079009 RepID=UPI0031B84F69
MFSFFFEHLYHIEAIRQAFRNICFHKMISDGYCDMSMYIYGRIKKDDMRMRLAAAKSNYAPLYDGAYPTGEHAYEEWEQKLDSGTAYAETEVHELTYDESSGIVNWVYRIWKNSKEREDFTRELLGSGEEFQNIRWKIEVSQGVVFNIDKVDLHFYSSISAVNEFLGSMSGRKGQLFFRGHADPNYSLLPSIMRTERLEQNESIMYHELLINCPGDFEHCHSHLEKLVKMQHYGLPTRLLDITRNPLVALYFACESRPNGYGELVLISAGEHEIKYPQSDTISILASLPVFSYHLQRRFCELAEDCTVDHDTFNRHVRRLIHEVRLEKPAFQPEIEKDDILNSYIVYALKNNSRIVKQDGAFILCGLRNKTRSLEEFRYEKDGKKEVVLITGKQNILNELDTFSINRAALFPEVECVAEYIKGKYSN